MWIEKLILTNFKNYEIASLSLHKRINAFVGLNGVGKTNLLDAIYYLCMCKSYFVSSDNDVLLRGGEFMRLEGIFQRNGKKEKIVLKFQPQNRTKKKIFERNEAAYSTLAEHIGLLPVVMIAPDDVRLATDGSEDRRRFLDAALSQIDTIYLHNLLIINKILEQRNAFLKKNIDQSQTFDEALLTIYDTQLLAPTQYIYEKRQAFVAQFSPIFNKIYATISGEKEFVKVIYESALTTNSYENLLRKNREKDRILGRTSVGIHRDDLSFEMDDKPLKRFGSQGQLKSFVVSLKLAQHELLRGGNGTPPILLLDDIFDKLDDMRIENLLTLLLQPDFGQIFLTDTHAERTQHILENLQLPFHIFVVEKGKIIQNNYQ